MIYKLIILLALITVASCQANNTKSNTSERNESLNKYNEKVGRYNANVIAPIMYLINNTCIYRSSNEKWPTTITPGSKSYFLEHNVSKLTPTYQATYKLKGSTSKWVVNQAYDDNEKSVCRGTLKAFNTKNKELISLNINTSPETVNNNDTATFKEFQKEMLPLSKVIYFSVAMAESNNNQTEQANAAVNSLSEFIVAASICVILDIGPCS